MKTFFKYFYLLIMLLLAVGPSVDIWYTSTTSNVTESEIIFPLIFSTIFGIFALLAHGIHLNEGKFKKIMIVLILSIIIFNYIFTSVCSFKNNLSIRYPLLFVGIVIISFVVSVSICLFAISMIKNAYPLTVSINYKAYIIQKIISAVPTLTFFILSIVYMVKMIITDYIIFFIVFMVVFFIANLIILIILQVLFKQAIDSKIYKLFYISKGSRREDVVEELSDCLDLRFGDNFETIRPYKLSGYEKITYLLVFDENGLFTGIEKNINQHWYVTVYR